MMLRRAVVHTLRGAASEYKDVDISEGPTPGSLKITEGPTHRNIAIYAAGAWEKVELDHYTLPDTPPVGDFMPILYGEKEDE